MSGDLSDDQRALCDRCRYGSLSDVIPLCKKVSSVNFKDDSGNTPLILAVYNKSYEIVEHLVKYANSFLSEVNLHRFTPLHLAAEHGLNDIVNLLIDQGALLNVINEKGHTPFMTAKVYNNEHTALLISNKLLSAVRERKQEIVLELLNQGIDTNSMNEQNQTALYLAVQTNNISIVQILLLRGANPALGDENGINPLDLATSKGYIRIQRYIEMRMPRIMPQYGATPEINTAAIVSIMPMQMPEMLRYINDDDIANIKRLIDDGFDCSVATVNGGTILHYCVLQNKPLALNYLVELPTINLDQRNNDGLSALVLSIKLGRRCLTPLIHRKVPHNIERVSLDSITMNTTRYLGFGSFGQVFEGEFKDQIVAVKISDDRDASKQEVDMIQLCHSPYIIQALAVAQSDDQTRIAYERMDYDLRDHLDLKLKDSETQVALTPLEIAWAIANGIADLHRNGIVHRDIKSKNVLLSKTLHVKLCDFGGARNWASTMTLQYIGTSYWQAPEIIMHQRYSYAADVYSFGIILYELSTNERPYDGNWNTLQHEICNGKRPRLHDNCERWLRDLARRCTANNPEARPTIQQVVDILYEELIRLHCIITMKGTVLSLLCPRSNEAEGGHAMTIVGYNDEYRTKDGYTGGYILKNSWWDGVDPPLGPAHARGSHSIRYFLQEISEYEERFNCPNSASPYNWYQCEGTEGVIHADSDSGVIRSPLNVTLIPKDICLSEDTRRDAESSIAPLHLECIEKTPKFCNKNATYFTRNMTEVGDRFQKMCFFEYRVNGTSSDICLPPMLTMDIAHVFQPVEKRENNPDVCGFYFYPYEKQRAGSQLGWEVSVDDLDVTWAPQSYLANAHRFPHLDYTWINQSTKVQNPAPIQGPIPVYVQRDEL